MLSFACVCHDVVNANLLGSGHMLMGHSLLLQQVVAADSKNQLLATGNAEAGRDWKHGTNQQLAIGLHRNLCHSSHKPYTSADQV